MMLTTSHKPSCGAGDSDGELMIWSRVMGDGQLVQI